MTGEGIHPGQSLMGVVSGSSKRLQSTYFSLLASSLILTRCVYSVQMMCKCQIQMLNAISSSRNTFPQH